MGDRITIVLKLPIEVGKVNDVLATIARTWPTTKIDLEGDDGWYIEVGPDEQMVR